MTDTISRLIGGHHGKIRRVMAACYLFLGITAVFASPGTRDTPGRMQDCGGVDVLDDRSMPVAAGVSDLLDTSNMTAWLDPLIATEMNSTKTAGLTLSIVYNGSILLTRGYGHANIGAGTPVDPNATLFRVGSVSKMFTAAAVMQLVEQGVLDLNENVNTYLDFELANPFPVPITLHRLLTHTAGFEESTTPYLWRLEDQINLRTALTTNPPEIVYEPGVVSSYSNYGVALAGYIVERVSGLPFTEYMEQNILVPLGMARSTFRQTLAEATNASFAIGYYERNGELVANDFPYVSVSPAGALASTAEEMGKWMLMLLQNGTYDGHAILNSTSVQTMSSGQIPCPAFVDQVGYGLFQSRINGTAIVGHNGFVGTFLTNLYLVPAKKFGLFICTSTPNFAVQDKVFTRLREEYLGLFHVNGTPPVQMTNGTLHATSVAGTYVTTRRVSTEIERIYLLSGFMGTIDVSVNPNGTIQLAGLTLVEVAPCIYSEIHGVQFHVVFILDSNGKASYMYVMSPTNSFARLEWYDLAPFHVALILVSIGFFAATLIAWLAGTIRRRTSAGPPLAARVRNGRLLYLGYFAPIMTSIWLVYAGMSGLLGSMTIPNRLLIFGMCEAFIIAGIVFYAGIVAQAFWLWKHDRSASPDPARKKYHTFGHTWYAIGVAMGLIGIYELFYWRILFF